MIVAIVIGFVTALVAGIIFGLCWNLLSYHNHLPSWSIAICIVLSLAIGVGAACFYANTETGKAQIKSTKSGISGMNRVVRVYTADGTLLAEYEGRFNIEDENGGIMFDYDGKRCIYWNCFVESIEK
jgi:hypothetical protein